MMKGAQLWKTTAVSNRKRIKKSKRREKRWSKTRLVLVHAIVMMTVRTIAVTVDKLSEEVIAELQQRLLQFIRSRVANETDAEDILQDSFQAMQKNAHQLKDERRLLSWVFQIVRNKIIDYYRRPKRRHEEIQDLEMETMQEAELGERLGPCLQHMLQFLPESDQAALTEIDVRGRAIKAYAQEAGLSESACKSRVQRARKKMRDMFQRCCQISSDQHGHLIAEKQTTCALCGPDCTCC